MKKTPKTFGHFNISNRNPAPFPRFFTCYTLLHLVTPKFFYFYSSSPPAPLTGPPSTAIPNTPAAPKNNSTSRSPSSGRSNSQTNDLSRPPSHVRSLTKFTFHRYRAAPLRLIL